MEALSKSKYARLGLLVRAAGSLLLLVATHCGKDRMAVQPQQADSDVAAELVPEPSPEFDPLYDAAGHVRESSEDIAGLRLPVGLTPFRDAESKRIFRSKIPLRKMLEYFGPRLNTAQVDRVGDGAIYRHAVAKDVEGGTTTLDVSIMPLPTGETRVEIVEHRPQVQRAPMSEAELKQMTRNHLKHLD